jgi:hypothetical protein
MPARGHGSRVMVTFDMTVVVPWACASSLLSHVAVLRRRCWGWQRFKGKYGPKRCHAGGPYTDPHHLCASPRCVSESIQSPIPRAVHLSPSIFLMPMLSHDTRPSSTPPHSGAVFHQAFLLRSGIRLYIARHFEK